MRATRHASRAALLCVALSLAGPPTARATYDPAGPYPALAGATARAAAYDPAGVYIDYGVGGGSDGSRFKSGLQNGFVLDKRGIPKVRYSFGTYYNPAVVARYGLAIIGAYLSTDRYHTARDLGRVRAIAEWLVTNQDRRGRWLFAFNLELRAIGTRVNAPWVSGMAQGVAMSFLTRAFRVTGDARYLTAAARALAPFARSTRRGGVVADLAGEPWYEEYPSVVPSHVLNGFMFSLIGLYDECRWQPRACTLFNVGMRSLRLRIGRFDRGRGSYYYPGRIPVGRDYQSLHVSLLTALTSVRRVPLLERVRRRWAAAL
jgi:heparosan-N-sulfate-glucuronate 5-epimerase